MSKLSFRARALDASKPMPIYLAEELPDLPDYSAINRAVPQMPSGMEKEEESEHHLQRAISGTGLIIPTPEVSEVNDIEFYERCYPPDYKMPKQHIHMQPLWEEQEAPEYDIDSEDERWLKQQRHPELTELKFEQMMDKLEKSSGQTVVTLSEAKLLLERNDDLVIAVYDYWLNKRLNTQHPLILSVKTESRPGQSTNNPYLAFRRRTEKMQTRKNRKNDESSYEKMLKLRRDLARALSLLELVGRRERAKRDLVLLTATIAARRYAAKDFASQLNETQHRPTFAPMPIVSSFRREYAAPHYQPRAPPALQEPSRQREKRPYKKRKLHRHYAPGAAHVRDSGVCTSSEEESSRAEATTPDDGPFAFRRKPGCYYQMPTSTLCGDPLDPENPSRDGFFEHEVDQRHRYTLASVSLPYPRCVGFARRRLGRGGRVLLDRVHTPLHDLLVKLPASETPAKLDDLEKTAYRQPKEIVTDYRSSGKYPWRHAFRKHLARHPRMWTGDNDVGDIKLELGDVKIDVDDVKIDVDVKMDVDDVKVDVDDVKMDVDYVKMDIDEAQTSDVPQCSVKSDISVSARTIDSVVKDNLSNALRKRAYSSSDSSYDSDDSLNPVEQEFERFYNEVNKKWLHFRPKTPPMSPPRQKHDNDQFPLASDTPLTVELHTDLPSAGIDIFTTSEFTLGDLYGDVINNDLDNSGNSLDNDLLNDNFTGLTEAQVESILSETDLKALADVDLTKDDKKMPLSEDLLDELVKDVDAKDFFLSQGQSLEGRYDSGPKRRSSGNFGSTVVHVCADSEPIYVDKETENEPEPPPPKIETPKVTKPKLGKVERVEPEKIVVPTSKIIVEEVNEVPQIKIEKKKRDDTIEEVQLAHGVQLKTVQTKHSPLKKHIITSAAHRRASDVVVTAHDKLPHLPQAPVLPQVLPQSLPQSLPQTSQPQIVTVAVSDSLKVRLQNQLLSSSSGNVVGVMQNGPFATVVPHHVTATAAVPGVSVATSSPRRVSAPLVHLAAASLSHKTLAIHPSHSHASHTIHHVAPNKLKVLHAHPLTHSQRTQLLGGRAIGGLGLGGVVLQARDKPRPTAQYIEINKGPQLVNVVRQPQPGKTTVARLDLNDAKKRQVVFDSSALKGKVSSGTLPARTQVVSVSLEGRGVVRAALPQLRHHIQLKNRTHAPIARPALANVSLPKQKIAISAGTGQPLSASVQAIAFSAAQLKARQARLIAQAPAQPLAEIVEATTAPVPSATASTNAPLPATDEETSATNGAVRRRPADTLPMEVT